MEQIGVYNLSLCNVFYQIINIKIHLIIIYYLMLNDDVTSPQLNL